MISFPFAFTRSLARAKHRLTLGFTLVGLLVLGACSTSDQLCPLNPPSVTRAAMDNVRLPEGCQLVGQTGSAVQEVSCADGRTGYAFN